MAKRLSLAQVANVPSAEPDLSPAHKNAVETAIRWPWQALVSANCPALTSGQEEDITAAIEEQLGKAYDGKRLAPGIKDFDHPVRGAKTVSVTGANGKQPDLTFRPPLYKTVTNSAHWGYCVECKLIQKGHGTRTVQGYCEEGIRRFASGEYAARMPSGMMIAYLRGVSNEPKTHLEKHLSPSSITPEKSNDVCSTTHARQTLAFPCVDIVLTHLWLTS